MVMRQAADGFTRPPFAHPDPVSQMSDNFPLGRERHHFFPKRCFSTTPGFRDLRTAELRFAFADAGAADAVLESLQLF